MQALQASEAELAEANKLNKSHYTSKKELQEKAEERVKMAGDAASAMKNSDGAYLAKEAGTKTQIASNDKKYSDEESQDMKLRSELSRVTADAQIAKDRKATTTVNYKRAAEDEKNSKNDALERNKKTEATAITNAIEKKNKAAEKAAMAYDEQATLRKNQLRAASAHHQSIRNTLVRLEQSKSILASKYGMTDAFQVAKMEKTAQLNVNFAESKAKMSIKVVERTGQLASDAANVANDKRVVFDQAKAELKKTEDLAQARKQAKEASVKSVGIAIKENAKKRAMKERQDADKLLREAVQNEGAAKFTLKAQKNAYVKAEKTETQTKKHAETASREKLDAVNTLSDAQQHQESSHKLADRFRTLTAHISENMNKQHASKASVQSEEKAYKYAEDQATQAKNSCSKGLKAKEGVGRAYAKLKTDMKQWSLKHKWLKQDSRAEESHEEMGEGKEDQAEDDTSLITKTSNDLVQEELQDDIAPDWAMKSVAALIQEEAGADVAEWVFT